MTSILDMNSGSSDSEDDCDYVPPTNAVSDESEEISDDETEFNEGPPSKKTKLSDKEENIEAPVDKKSDDDIWKSFMQGVETTSSKKPILKTNLTSSSAVSDSVELKQNETKNEHSINKQNGEDQPKINANGESNNPNASTELEVNKQRSDTDAENKSIGNKDNEKTNTLLTASSNKGPVARGGISSILGTLANKGKKQTVLQKTLEDWKSFKEDEGIGKDLETYNKGRQGYIERQRFLQRSDFLSYEKERDMRLFGKKR